jgi:hypothetical protein
VGAVDAEVVEEFEQVLDVVVEGVAGGGASVQPWPRRSWDGAEAVLSEEGGVALPEAAVSGVAVEEDDRRAIAFKLVVGEDAVGLGYGHGESPRLIDHLNSRKKIRSVLNLETAFLYLNWVHKWPF